MKKIKEFWKNFKLNHHSCDRNSKLIDSFSTSFTSTDDTTFGVSVSTTYKCEICGKISHVD